jgi:hypothetical protein
MYSIIGPNGRVVNAVMPLKRTKKPYLDGIMLEWLEFLREEFPYN